MSISEQQIQSKIKKYAETKGWIVVKTIKLSSAGFPDLFMFKDSKTLFIEVKKPNNQDGVLAEHKRIQTRFENKKFRKFVNLTQLMVEQLF
jgi:Holliday junction resolvase